MKINAIIIYEKKKEKHSSLFVVKLIVGLLHLESKNIFFLISAIDHKWDF